MRVFFSIIIFVALFASCKTPQSSDSEGLLRDVEPKNSVGVDASVSEIASAHYRLFGEFNTLKINGKLHYQDEAIQLNPNVEIQLEKGKQILLSSTVFLFSVKVYFSPERASFYDTYNGTFYDGNYEFISNFLGTEVSYENIENLLLGKAFYNIHEHKYSKQSDSLLELKLNRFLIKLLLGNHNEIETAEIHQRQSVNKLVVQYPLYQTVDGLFLPKEINIQAIQKENVRIKIDYRKIVVNPVLDFRYQIPRNSKEIRI